jgi:hypothetical protein
MNIEQLNKIIIGKWKLNDGRVLDFHTNKDFTLTYSNGEINPEKQKMFLSKNKYGSIQFTCIGLLEPLALIKSFSNNEIIYDSYDPDGTTTEFVLTKI